jgi:hypothetical protein
VTITRPMFPPTADRYSERENSTPPIGGSGLSANSPKAAEHATKLPEISINLTANLTLPDRPAAADQPLMSRRSALSTSLLPMVAAVPTEAQALPSNIRHQTPPGDHPDAALLALDRDLSDYLAESEPIRLALVKVADEHEVIERPTALAFRHRDHWMPFFANYGSAIEREKVGIVPDDIVELLRDRKYPRSGEFMPGVSYREVNARVREILKADDRWQKAKHRQHARLVAKYDIDENKRRWEALEARRTSLMDRVLDSTAKTLDGVMVKVRFRKWFGEYDPHLDVSSAIQEVAVSIADDLSAMAERPPLN